MSAKRVRPMQCAERITSMTPPAGSCSALWLYRGFRMYAVARDSWVGTDGSVVLREPSMTALQVHIDQFLRW